MKKIFAFTSIIALALVFAPAASHAAWSNDVNITTTNSADIVNSFNVSAHTGDNVSKSGSGGASGGGGSVTNSGSANTGGAGGAGGAGGEGGVIATGDASVSVLVTNIANDTDIEVDSTALAEDASDNDVNIITSNTAALRNEGVLSAFTGSNKVKAGSASSDLSGTGGSVDSSGNENVAGAGGASGAGGMGGSIVTGHSTVSADVMSIVNMTVKRVMR
ncbi:MAG: hypothetical protein WC757_01020 [Candidatus Paceibacterota bacterium]|jgi:hypothetical protein